jgi:hypothetical protein
MRLDLQATTLAMFLAAGFATAGPLEDGTAAYDRRDYAGALRLLLPLAEHGNARAQAKIGSM